MSKKNYHFIGIGGIGMSGLASILLEKQRLVSGSDLMLSKRAQALASLGAKLHQGHSKNHISKDQIVVYSSGIQSDNVELKAAKLLGCTLLHRSELLADLMGGERTFAVTGTHGKTSTAALLAATFREGGFDPSFALGGVWKSKNGHLGRGEYFVAEADESDGSLLNYTPEGAIITNIEPEHMDYFGSQKKLEDVFSAFLARVKKSELLFYCGDDSTLCRLARARGVSYGFSSSADIQITRYEQIGWESSFDLEWRGEIIRDIRLNLVGKHHALNAAAVFGLARTLGIDEATLRRSFANFSGVERRCHRRGSGHLDDYAHHPTEIRATLEGVKKAVGERRLIAIFQPHRYTRTRDTLEKYKTAFEWADEVWVTDIYEAGEKPILGVTAAAVAEEIEKEGVRYVARDQLGVELKRHLRSHDLFITLGAGDITHLHEEGPFEPRKWRVGLIFGGESPEHEISLRSAQQVLQALNTSLYEVELFGIDRLGGWLHNEKARSLLEGEKIEGQPLFHPDIASHLDSCELFLPILHGRHGEDGTIQGLFELLGKPYVGPDHCSAAICMDKMLTKNLVKSANVPTPHAVQLDYEVWREEKKIPAISLPLYVKPTHLGSSIGIRFVEKKEELLSAIEKAFEFDSHVMLEEAKLGCRELEFACIGNSSVAVPPPGEKISGGTFVDYGRKYGERAVATTVDTALSEAIIAKGQNYARRAYQAVGCSGMARVDFLLDAEEEFWFFEMNPIPGMQPLSLFPKVWAREGVSLTQLLDRLVILALERHRNQKRHPHYHL